jgi:hypothetical protein
VAKKKKRVELVGLAWQNVCKKRFADDVLAFLCQDDEEWDADTIDDICFLAKRYGLLPYVAERPVNGSCVPFAIKQGSEMFAPVPTGAELFYTQSDVYFQCRPGLHAAFTSARHANPHRPHIVDSLLQLAFNLGVDSYVPAGWVVSSV